MLTTGAPHSAAKRIACFRYSVLISGLHSGVWAEKPDSLTPAFSQARRIRSGSSSIETLWKYPASLSSSRPQWTIGSTYS